MPEAYPVALCRRGGGLLGALLVRGRVLEGNADERGTREYNFALGARRAQTVSDFLVSKGVVPARISTISYGKENPIDPVSTEDAWAKNRNAHTSLTSGAPLETISWTTLPRLALLPGVGLVEIT